MMLYAHWTEMPEAAWRWANFMPAEAACRCCGELWLDVRAMDMLQAARDTLGKPMRINSGHRCAGHNTRVGGAPASAHREIAFDISIVGQDRHAVLEACIAAGFTTFGFYASFLHADTRPDRRWFGAGAREKWNL